MGLSDIAKIYVIASCRLRLSYRSDSCTQEDSRLLTVADMERFVQWYSEYMYIWRKSLC